MHGVSAGRKPHHNFPTLRRAELPVARPLLPCASLFLHIRVHLQPHLSPGGVARGGEALKLHVEGSLQLGSGEGYIETHASSFGGLLEEG